MNLSVDKWSIATLDYVHTLYVKCIHVDSISLCALIPHSPLQAEGSRERFQLISTAYEILKDEEERANYDYMLENPGRYRARG